MIATTNNNTTTTWTLTECSENGAAGKTHLIADAECVIGRAPPATLVIESPAVSKKHASLCSTSAGLLVRDLGSTNGTFLNGSRIHEACCNEGDLIQFAKTVFRVSQRTRSHFGATLEGGALPYAESLLEFDQLMNGRGLLAVFQPIVSLQDYSIVAYELLARSVHQHLRNPQTMFGTAALLGQECHLSELMRTEGVRITALTKNCPNLFVNTHPKEIINPRFLASLASLRQQHADLKITLEIHEAAITDRREMLEFRQILREHSMLLAYDDFGAGQARLDELSEIPPDYLKFDIKLIRDLDTATPARRAMIQSLVNMTRELGICPLAEGVETTGETAACQEVGFELAQGYFFGRPEAWKTNGMT
jgi:EAL domain-containing protein (putative c-di-GMP-specific phosphodiesterase class I)